MDDATENQRTFPKSQMYHFTDVPSLLNLEAEDHLPEVQAGAHSRALGCVPPAAEVSRCVQMKLGSLHEVFGGLSPVLPENIINSRIIWLDRQIHRQIYCTFIGTASG